MKKVRLCHNYTISIDELYIMITELSKEECRHPTHRYNIEQGSFAAIHYDYIQ